jgi:hypothetical protein
MILDLLDPICDVFFYFLFVIRLGCFMYINAASGPGWRHFVPMPILPAGSG